MASVGAYAIAAAIFDDEGDPADGMRRNARGGVQLTGIAPITRANDPFWNVRAFDNACRATTATA